MLKTLGIIEVRHRSHQSAVRVGRKLGGKSLLELVVRRVTDCQRIDGVVVVCGREDEEAIRRLVPADVPVFVPTARDCLAGFVATVDALDARAIVHVAADSPFIDPVLVDRLVSTADAHPDCDYISYCCADGRPAILAQWGVVAEWCSAASLRRAHREAKRPADRDQATGYLRAKSDVFKARLIPLPPELDREDLRLKIDGEEDWEHAQVIYEALGHDEWDWQRIADLLDTQPALRKRMAVLNRAKSTV